MEATERARELAMMRGDTDAEPWMYWPLLPVVRRRDQEVSEGVMVAGVPRVWLTNIHMLPSGKLRDILSDVQHLDYADYDAVIDAGWRVD